MAFCKACGQDIGNANFCPKCGASQAASAPVSPAAAPVVVSTDGVQENVAGLLCYLPVVGWVIALVFFLIDRRPFVKFHAVQSLALHVALIVLYAALGIFSFMHIFFLTALLYPLLWLGSFIVLILMMVKAYQHEKFKLPVLGDFAEGFAK